MRFLSGVLSAIMLFTAGSVAASFEMAQYEETGNIYIEGDLTGTNRALVDSVTIQLYDKAGGDIKHISQLSVDDNRVYRTKFKYNGDTQNLGVYVRYNGEDLNDTLNIAKVTGKSEVANAKIVLLKEDGKAIDLSDYEAAGMPVHEYGQYSFQSKSIISNAQSAKAMIYVNNKYGDNVCYDVILSFYDNNGRMLSADNIDERNVGFDSFADSYYLSTEVEIPENAASVKGFVWQDGYSLIPFNNTAEDKLDNISMFIIGDSTYGQFRNDYYEKDFPKAAIGAYLPDYFNTKYLNIQNFAIAGTTTSMFVNEWIDKDGNKTGDWLTVQSLMKKGDYLLITHGINDCPNTESFKSNLISIIETAHDRGVNVILGTAIGLGTPNAGADFRVGGTALWQMETFNELKEMYPFITILDIAGELANRSKTDTDLIGDGTLTYEEIAINYKRKYHNYSDYFAEDWGITDEEHIKNHHNYNPATGKVEDNHLNARGADIYAKLISELIASSDLDLKYYVK